MNESNEEKMEDMELQKRIRAFEELQKLSAEFAASISEDFDPMKEYYAALEEKYGI